MQGLFQVLLSLIRRIFFLIGILWLAIGTILMIVNPTTNRNHFLIASALVFIPSIALFLIGKVFSERSEVIILNDTMPGEGHVSHKQNSLLEQSAWISSLVAAAIALLSFFVRLP